MNSEFLKKLKYSLIVLDFGLMITLGVLLAKFIEVFYFPVQAAL